MKRAVWLLGLALFTVSAVTLANERASRYVVVVSGIGGEAFYSELFHRWAVSFIDLARDNLNIDSEQIYYLAEDPSHAPGRITGAARKEEIMRTLRTVAQRSAPEDQVWILLIGHGTARGNRVLFNLPGPDISTTELVSALDLLKNRRIVLVNAASASGPFVQALSQPGRVVITATSSGAENQHPHFGGYFVTAFATPVADGDKDGRVSLLEAFVFANGEVARGYERRKQLQTEHALLDDDGDGVGSRAPGGANTDGRLAARVFLAQPAVDGPANPRILALTAAARTLVDRIALLQRRKRELPESEYEAQLESLLVELALNRRALRTGALP